MFVGGQAPLAFVGVEGAVVRYNTIYRPEKWVLRILQETTQPGFVACRRGELSHNLIVFRRSDVSVIANIGPHTQPETFTFADNLWYCEDRPAASRPDLPAEETGGRYGLDPQLADPARANLSRVRRRPRATARRPCRRIDQSALAPFEKQVSGVATPPVVSGKALAADSPIVGLAAIPAAQRLAAHLSPDRYLSNDA